MNLKEALSTAIITQQARAGVTNRDLSKALDVSETQIVKYRTGQTAWPLGNLDTIANALKLDNGWQLLELAKNEALIAERATVA